MGLCESGSPPRPSRVANIGRPRSGLAACPYDALTPLLLLRGLLKGAKRLTSAPRPERTPDLASSKPVASSDGLSSPSPLVSSAAKAVAKAEDELPLVYDVEDASVPVDEDDPESAPQISDRLSSPSLSESRLLINWDAALEAPSVLRAEGSDASVSSLNWIEALLLGFGVGGGGGGPACRVCLCPIRAWCRRGRTGCTCAHRVH